jgi:hypothetical protein
VTGAFVFTEHSLTQMVRRQLPIAAVLEVVRQAEQEVVVRPGRIVRQAQVALGPAGKVYLVRVVMDVDRTPAEVVTAYRTTRFSRQGSPPP